MLLPIIIIFIIIIIGLTLVCAALHRISKLEIRYPETFGENEKLQQKGKEIFTAYKQWRKILNMIRDGQEIPVQEINHMDDLLRR